MGCGFEAFCQCINNFFTLKTPCSCPEQGCRNLANGRMSLRSITEFFANVKYCVGCSPIEFDRSRKRDVLSDILATLERHHRNISELHSGFWIRNTVMD